MKGKYNKSYFYKLIDKSFGKNEYVVKNKLLTILDLHIRDNEYITTDEMIGRLQRAI
jgi:hypothetical protein